MYRFLVLLALCSLSASQFFDSKMDDRAYLDNVEQEVEEELVAARSELMEHAKAMENVTRAYIAVKLKENVFRALRMIAEHELTKMKSGAKPYVRQDPDDYVFRQEEDEYEEDKTEKSTTPLTGLGTAVKVNQQVFSFLGEAFNIIFGGTKPKPKKYIDQAAVLTQDSKDVQILGLVSLLAREEENMPLPEVQAADAGDVEDKKKPLPVPYPGLVISKTSKKGEKEQDHEDVNLLEDDFAQDGRIFDLFNLLKRRNKNTLGSKKNESLSGFDDEPGKKTGSGLLGIGGGLGQSSDGQRFNLEKFVRNFKKSVNELQANVPDIYRGVREAYKLLDTLRGVASRLEEFAEDIF